jgi:tetratricopeptide (TPR) repeat protein
MAHDKVNRYSTMQELADDLRAAQELRPVRARQPGPFLKAQRFAQRHAGYVLLVCLIGLVAAAGFSLTERLRRQRDVALQVQALRNGELATRTGQWRDALHDWDEAESAGFNDPVFLGLQRAEAWTVLNEPKRSQAELAKLMRRSDLKDQRGIVLLKMGEHELFDQQTSDVGVGHIIEALGAGLSRADEAFAKGLLAPSSPEALSLFRQALASNPYHHGAHVHTMGLEFLLGQRQELDTEIHIFRTLYPEDPSPVFLNAMELASEGRLAEARSRLALVNGAASPETLGRLESACQQMAAAAEYYDADTFLALPQTNLNQLFTETAPLLSSSDSSAAPSPTAAIRIPQLPCVKQGMTEGFNAIRSLMIPLLTNPRLAVQKIKSGWQHHPEALMPALAGILLERCQPRQGPRSMALVLMQSDLFQIAADSPSILPHLPALARYLAARSQFELASNQKADTHAAARACLDNIRRANAAEDCSFAELAAYYDFAFALQDYDLARELLVKMERSQPENPIVIHQRVELELAVGALGAARERIQETLAHNPSDAWGLKERKTVIEKIKNLAAAPQRP